MFCAELAGVHLAYVLSQHGAKVSLLRLSGGLGHCDANSTDGIISLNLINHRLRHPLCCDGNILTQSDSSFTPKILCKVYDPHWREWFTSWRQLLRTPNGTIIPGKTGALGNRFALQVPSRCYPRTGLGNAVQMINTAARSVYYV